MSFKQQTVWLKSSFVLITIGFVVWVSAGTVWDVDDSFTALFVDLPRYRAYVAFMIIGIIAYYGAVMLNFLYIFVPDTEGHPIVLIVGAALGILAGISGIISSSIGSVVPFSDRLTWALVCAFVSAAFLIVSMICGSGASGIGGGGGGGDSAAAHTADFQPQQEVPA